MKYSTVIERKKHLLKKSTFYIKFILIAEKYLLNQRPEINYRVKKSNF